MIECPKCKAKFFTNAELEQHDVISHLADEIKTIDCYTVIKFSKQEHAQKYIKSISGSGVEWNGPGWYVLDSKYFCLQLEQFIKINEDAALKTITDMTNLRRKVL